MSLTLKPARVLRLPGQTLVSHGHGWLTPTGVYVPDNANFDHGSVNILLWIHGYFVPGVEQLLGSDPAKMRDQISNSHKNIVLAAPWMGWHPHKGEEGKNTYSVAPMGRGVWGKKFLDQVVDALGSVVSRPLQLGKLVIACHSGGGGGMRELVGTLGPHAKLLRECWGFDCLYGAKSDPDDATFWYGRALGKDTNVPLYVSFGPSTTPQSVKLYLMAQGLAASDGTRRSPKAPAVGGLNVTLGMASTQTIDDLTESDTIPDSPPPTRHMRSRERPKSFAELAAINLSKKMHWPDDIHYQIAREGMLARLKAASFL